VNEIVNVSRSYFVTWLTRRFAVFLDILYITGVVMVLAMRFERVTGYINGDERHFIGGSLIFHDITSYFV